MRSKIASFLALCLLVSACAAAQSLGAVARKERERREKNKETGVTVREYSEDEIFEQEEEEATEGEDDADVEGESDAADGAMGSPLPDRIDIEVEAVDDPSQRLEEESQDRKRQEAEWRSKFHEARERVKLARQQKAVWDGVTYVDGLVLVDENGNVVVDSRDDLAYYVSQATRELSDAEQALETLEEQARRAGVPPGWLR